MKLTQKDKAFLAGLKRLIESANLTVELCPGEPSRMVLRGTYGQKVHDTFGMTRQGVRWRFQRVFGDIYVSSFETILFIERIFGTQLRDHAIRISRERYAMATRCETDGFVSADVLLRQKRTDDGDGDVS